MSRRLDLSGRIYGRLTVESNVSYHPTKWQCRCSCGRVTVVALSNLQTGNTTSCGCVHSERTSAKFTTHGMTGTPEYKAWLHLRDRCTNPADKCYRIYGARGITVCDRWRYSFANFFADMGRRPSPHHSIDRINFNGNYEKTNCRWALPIVQANNSRKNRHLTLGNTTHTVAEWGRQIGIPAANILARLRLGWSVERALTTPVR